MATLTLINLRELVDYDQTLIIRPNKGKGSKPLEAVVVGADDVNIAKIKGNDPCNMIRGLAKKVEKLDA